MNMSNRGTFSIDASDLRTNPAERIREYCHVFFTLGIMVVRAEMLFERDVIRYTAIGECFREVSPNAMTPEYTLEVSVDENNKITGAWMLPKESA